MPSSTTRRRPQDIDWTALQDPRVFCKVLWPHQVLYRKQIEIMDSIWRNDRTTVPACNMSGKDYIAARIVLWFFLTRHPCRIVTTSAKDQHLRVLWGEIGQAIATARVKLTAKSGGPLVTNHQDMRKLLRPGDANSRCPISYVVGMVASQDSQAAMQGHHATATLEDYLRLGLAEADIDHSIPRTLFVVDEASSVPDYYMALAQTWAKRIFVFGNPWPCSNFFYRDVEGTPGTEDKGGDIPNDNQAQENSDGPTDAADEGAGELPGGNGAADQPARGVRGDRDQSKGTGAIGSTDDANCPAGAGASRSANDGSASPDPGADLGANSKTHAGTSRTGPTYLRRVIRITAEDSPNVRLALTELAAGKEPSHRILVPGVLTYAEYLKRKRLYDDHQQAVSLRGEFYKGKELFLFPKIWLDLAERTAKSLLTRPRRARAVGIDPGEGEANTAFAAVDEFGLIDLESHKTPQTNDILDLTFRFVRKHGVSWDNVVFDRGGGGKQIADVLRHGASLRMPDGTTFKFPGGYPVRTVGFGETITQELKRARVLLEEKKELREDHYVYLNRRAEMYGELAVMLDPGFTGSTLGDTKIVLSGFGLPLHFMKVLRPQMEPIPKWYDREGRLILPAKSRKPGEELNEKQKTLVELVGRSPDELEALVLAVHGMLHKVKPARAGVA